MVELQTATDGRVVPGFEREKCVFMNVDEIRLPLRWQGSGQGAAAAAARSTTAVAAANSTNDSPPPPSAGTKVQLRLFFRDATIYAFGLS